MVMGRARRGSANARAAEYLTGRSARAAAGRVGYGPVTPCDDGYVRWFVAAGGDLRALLVALFGLTTRSTFQC